MYLSISPGEACHPIPTLTPILIMTLNLNLTNPYGLGTAGHEVEEHLRVMDDIFTGGPNTTLALPLCFTMRSPRNADGSIAANSMRFTDRRLEAVWKQAAYARFRLTDAVVLFALLVAVAAAAIAVHGQAGEQGFHGSVHCAACSELFCLLRPFRFGEGGGQSR